MQKSIMGFSRCMRMLVQLGYAAATLAAGSARADDNHLFHPAFNARMAVSDRSTTTGLQPWVWMATAGDASSGSILVAKQADTSATSAWTFTFATLLTSAPDAISWTDGSNARQRIFYSSGGALQMLNWDNNIQNSFTTLPNASTFSVPFGDQASVTWVSGFTRRFAIAGYAAKNGTNGHLCFWEKTSTGSTWSVSCTASPQMSSVNDPLPDIVGVVQGTTPVFFFRNAAGRLARARRTAVAEYTIQELGTESLGPSLFATNSQTAGSVDVGVIRTSDNRVRVARLSSSTSTSPTWTTLPALPGGAVPVTNANVTLSGASYPITPSGSSTRTQVAVISSTLRLHTIRTTNNAGTTWETAWTAGVVPGRGTVPGPEQVIAGLGPTTGNPPANGARLFFVGGGAFGSDFATTLQEYWFGFPRPWRDHVRFTFGNGGIEPAATGATESAAGIGPVYGLAAAIQRNNPAPWRIVMASSDDGASSFGATLQMTAVLDSLGTRSASDPIATHGGFGGHLLHFADLELTKAAATCTDTGDPDLISYRRGSTASDIASGAEFIVATGPSFDHPGIGVTVDAGDLPTAHVLWWDVNASQTKYWTLAPGDVIGGPFVISSLPALPAGISVGNMQSQVYGWTFVVGGGFPTICKMNGSQGSGLTCGTPALSPAPFGKDIHFGPQVTDAQNGDCAGLASGGSTRFYKCFDTEQPAAVYADPTQANRVHIAYQALDSGTGRLAIFYTRNTDSNLAMWTPPVKIASDAAQELINPAISVDYDGTIVVTYSRIQAATFATPTNGTAQVRVTWSTLDSGTWSTAGQVVEDWDAENLPFHCGRRKWFLGEYRYPDVVAGRAVHLLPSSDGTSGGVVRQHALWFSGSYNLD
jgi:hypothetical protein